jgi:hypothetical protein
MLAVEYTPGGHRRFQFHDIERFAAEHGITLPGSTAQILDFLVVDSDTANDCMIKPVRNDALISALGLDNAPPLQVYRFRR